MPIVVRSKGNFKRTRKLLTIHKDAKIFHALEKYARMGVEALAAATPVDSGETANSWGYEIIYNNGSARINWTNSHTNQGYNIAVLLQLGHGTGTGGWVEGRDFINPSLQPIFNEIADQLWKEVQSV